jgi:methionine-rich copper-binding protein CopC
LLNVLQKLFFTKNNLVVVISFFIIIATIISLYSGTAYGHATPVSYSPPTNAVISMQQQQSLPDKVIILFSERPEPKVSYIHVTNSENKRVDNNDFKITGQNDREATITLDKSKLSDGVYSVSWLVLSRDDGHITKGSYVFNIQPPQSKRSQQEIISTGQNANAFSESSVVDNLNLTLIITPFYVGQNTFNVILTNESGMSPTNIRNVILSFSNQEAEIGPLVANLNKTGQGEFSAQGSYLSQLGNWEIGVTAQRSRAYDINHTFETMVKASAVNNTSSS